MKKEDAIKRLNELRPLLKYYTQKYFDDEQVISDFEYDMLMLELKGIEKEFPDLITEDSPTQKVGASIKKGFEKFEHEVPLLSLQDIFSIEEVEQFDKRVKKDLGVEKIEYSVEAKIDGLSVAIEYKNGEFLRGATRGNGTIGEDITENLKTIKNIPKKLKDNVDIIVRGEVFISKSDFAKMNEEQEILEEKPFANARNAAAGSLRQLDSKKTAKRPLDIYIFNIQRLTNNTYNSHFEQLKYLEYLGFNVIPERFLCENINEAIEQIKKIGEKREKLNFGTDGAVVKIDNLKYREMLGNTFKTPKWAVAYKYPPERKETILKDIKCQVGRTRSNNSNGNIRTNCTCRFNNIKNNTSQ